MNLEELLERGLAAAADDYDVPAGGIDRVREQLAPATAESDEDVVRRRPWHWRPTGHAWLGIAAALIVLLIAVPLAIGGSGSGQGESASLGSAAPGRVDGAGVGGGGVDTNGAKRSSLSTHELPQAAATPAQVPAHLGSMQLYSSAAGVSGTTSDSAPQRSVDPVPVNASRVEKTGELDLQVPKGQVSATLSKLSDIARFDRGYVSGSSTQESGTAPSGEVTIRVPVANFEKAVHDARSITGTKVLSLQTSGVDVTSKYVDLQARIKALKASRSTFLTILSKATTIGEILSVQQRVDDVQTQIEQLQGQLRVLASTTSMSTLTVTVDQKLQAIAPAKKPHHDNGFVKAVKLSVSRFVHGVEAIVGVIGPIVLVLLIVVLGWLAARFGYRATRRHLV